MDTKFTAPVYFISGIDTDAGKSYATAYLARLIGSLGKSVITQKLIQTGNNPQDISEDILTHRRLQGIKPLEEDRSGLTCPLIFRLPSSPHLAARLEGKNVEIELATRSTKILSDKFDIVLVEGAGGIMVPIREDYSTADYVVDQKLPIIIVSSARLGSLNHTLLTLEYCKSRNIEVAGVIYNLYPKTEPLIEEDTRRMIQKYLERNYPNSWLLDLPQL